MEMSQPSGSACWCANPDLGPWQVEGILAHLPEFPVGADDGGATDIDFAEREELVFGPDIEDVIGYAGSGVSIRRCPHPLTGLVFTHRDEHALTERCIVHPGLRRALERKLRPCSAVSGVAPAHDPGCLRVLRVRFRCMPTCPDGTAMSQV